MVKSNKILVAALAALIGGSVIAGCDSRANEEEDVRQAAQKLDEEKRDLARED